MASSTVHIICARTESRRLQLGLSYGTIAGRVGAKEPTVKTWCEGKHVPSARWIRAISAALHCHPDYIIGLRDDPGEAVEGYFEG